MRQKTYTAASDQWRKTVEITEAWVDSVKPILAVFPSSYEDLEEWADAFRRLEGGPLVKSRGDAHNYLNFLSRFDVQTSWTFGDPWIIGRAAKNSPRFVLGDLCLVTRSNGLGRQPVWSCTSKGRRLTGYYLDTNIASDRKCEVQVARSPGELVGLRLTDPDPELLSARLRAGGWFAVG
jgi:hypothetical protein